ARHDGAADAIGPVAPEQPELVAGATEFHDHPSLAASALGDEPGDLRLEIGARGEQAGGAAVVVLAADEKRVSLGQPRLGQAIDVEIVEALLPQRAKQLVAPHEEQRIIEPARPSPRARQVAPQPGGHLLAPRRHVIEVAEDHDLATDRCATGGLLVGQRHDPAGQVPAPRLEQPVDRHAELRRHQHADHRRDTLLGSMVATTAGQDAASASGIALSEAGLLAETAGASTIQTMPALASQQMVRSPRARASGDDESSRSSPTVMAGAAPSFSMSVAQASSV